MKEGQINRSMRVQHSCKRPPEETPEEWHRVVAEAEVCWGDDVVSLQEPLPAIMMRSVTSKACALSRLWAIVASES
jgi:hypothetical protein